MSNKTIVSIELGSFRGEIAPEIGSVEVGWYVKFIYEDNTSMRYPSTSFKAAFSAVENVAAKAVDAGKCIKVIINA